MLTTFQNVREFCRWWAPTLENFFMFINSLGFLLLDWSHWLNSLNLSPLPSPKYFLSLCLISFWKSDNKEKMVVLFSGILPVSISGNNPTIYQESVRRLKVWSLKCWKAQITGRNSALWADVSSVIWTWDFPLKTVTALPLEEPSVKLKIEPSKGWTENFFGKITECVFKKCKTGLEGKWNKIWPLKSIRATFQSSLFCKRNCSWLLLNGITILVTFFFFQKLPHFFFYLL